MDISVPTIDISGLPGDRTAIGKIADACETWGFFQIVGHRIDAAERAAFIETMRDFFHLPKARKHGVQRSAENPMGFFDEELTKNTRDWKEVFDFGIDLRDPTANHPSRWPADLPDFRETMVRWYESCEQVSFSLLGAIETSMAVETGTLTTHFDPINTSFLRLNYYPVCADPAPANSPTEIRSGNLGVNRHTDAGGLTVLVQDDVAALQVSKAGRWHTIVPEPSGLIVNVGDMLQVWSNDRFQAPEHRVIANASQERFSAPFFFNPDYRTDCMPLTNPPRYRPVNWGHFRRERAAGDYADDGEEIQITQFRIDADGEFTG